VTAEAATRSLKDQILAARAAGMEARTEDFEIPGFGGRLWGTFRALDDYAEVRKIGQRLEKVHDPVEQEMCVAADTLIRASVDCFAVIDGERHPLDATFGLPLGKYLGLAEEGDTARQAVFGLFEGKTMDLMTLFNRYSEWRQGAQAQVDEETEGKSEAPS